MTALVFIIFLNNLDTKRENKRMKIDFATGIKEKPNSKRMTTPGSSYYNILYNKQKYYHRIFFKSSPVVKVPSGMKKAPTIIATAVANLKNQNLRQKEMYL